MKTTDPRAGEEAPVPPAKGEVERAEKIRAAGRRALAEAAARRTTTPQGAPGDEIGGRAGLEPTRYGDWEKKGLATDF